MSDDGGDEPPPGVERMQVPADEWTRGLRDDIDPLKHAGEGFFSVDEYARPDDIEDPYVRGDVVGYGDYYPPPDFSRRRRL